MGRMPLQKDKLELLTTDFHHRILVGERVSRYLMENELLIMEAPLRKKGQPLPLCNLAAWVGLVEVQINGKDSVAVRGKVEGKALFYSEGGPQEVFFEDKEFFQEVNVPGAIPGMEVNGHGRISYIGEEGPPLEPEGKLLYKVKIETEVLLTVVDTRQLELGVGVKNISPEKLERRVIMFEELLQENAFPLTLSGELAFSGELSYLKVLSYHLADLDWQQEKGKIQLQGNLVTLYFYKTAANSGFGENRQFFKQDIHLPGLEKGYQVAVFPVVEYVACDLQGERARQRAYVDLFLRVTRNVQQEVLMEIEGVDTYKEYLLLPRAAGVTGERLEIVQRIPFPYPKEIAAGTYRLRGLQAQVKDDGVTVSGILERNVYYIPEQAVEEADEEIGEELGADETEGKGKENWPLSLKVEEPFQHYLHLPGVRSGGEALLYVKADKCEYAPAEAATLQVSYTTLEVKVRQAEEYAIVVPSRVPPGTSVVIYAVKKGDNLLRIARNYGIKPADLAESNALTEDDTLIVGQKLLIPLMLYRC